MVHTGFDALPWMRACDGGGRSSKNRFIYSVGRLRALDAGIAGRHRGPASRVGIAGRQRLTMAWMRSRVWVRSRARLPRQAPVRLGLLQRGPVPLRPLLREPLPASLRGAPAGP